ncbi:MAG: hypothetical protein AAGB24_06200 [Bacteroidota bacterium]
MKTSFKIFVALTALATFICACSSSDDMAQMMDDDVSVTDDANPTDDDPGEDSTGEFNPVEVEVSVALPDDSNIDLTTTEIVSLAETFKVDASGTATLPLFEKKKTFVYLINENEEILLTGFLSNEQKKLSIESTAVSTLFYGLGIVFLTEEIRNIYFNEITQDEAFVSSLNALEKLFVQDGIGISNSSKIDWTLETIKKFEDHRRTIDIKNSILLDDNSIKSGLRVIQDASDPFSTTIVNEWRRRAKAFFYKTAVKKEGQSQFVTLKEFISRNDKADATNVISPTLGATSAQGTIRDLVFGNGLNYGFSLNGPTNLALSDEEIAARYKIRIIGPGALRKTLNSTNDEIDALLKLKIETVLLDFVIPIISTTISTADIIDTSKSFEIGPLIEAANVIVGGSPNVIDALDDGDYKTAASEFLKAVLDAGIGTETFWENVVKIFNKNGVYNINPVKLAEKAAAVLTIVNAFVLTTDAYRIIDHIKNANELETFEITVTRSNVKINPKIGNVAQGDLFKVSANILDDEQISPNEYVFKWSTSGNFGEFQDDVIDDRVDGLTSYKAFRNDNLPEGAKDKIYLEVFKGDALVGRDSSEVNIRANDMQISPDNVIIDGDDNLKLSVVDINGRRIENSEELGYLLDGENFQIVWNTNGSYGKFEGSNLSTTTRNNSSVTYQSFDNEVERGEEIIYAKVYLEDSDGDDKELIAELETTIIIENDDRYIYKYITYNVWGNPPAQTEDGRCATSAGTRWLIEPEPNAESYTVTVLRFFNPLRSAYSGFEGDKVSWTVGGTDEREIESIKVDENGNPIDANSDEADEDGDANEDDPEKEFYVWNLQSASRGSLGPKECGSSFSEWYDSVTGTYGATDGYAQVKIKLKSGTN